MEAKSFMYCAIPKCSAWICLDDVKTSTVKCSTCKTVMCTKCKKLEHKYRACEESKEDNIFKQLVKDQKGKWKQCPKCKQLIEKNSGCNHMICKMCNTGFCWACVKVYVNGVKPCKCNQWENV